MGDINMKKHTRLGTKKLRDIAYIKTELRREQAREGVAVKRLKCKFGNSASNDEGPQAEGPVTSRVDDEEIARDLEGPGDRSESDSEPDDDDEPQTFTRIAQEMEAQANADSDSDGQESDDELPDTVTAASNQPVTLCFPTSNIFTEFCIDFQAPGPTITILPFFSRSYHITIEDLFNWSIEKGWDLFWDTGKRHYRDEMIFYDLLAQANTQDGTNCITLIFRVLLLTMT
jgi:hypothetical protein